GDLVGVQLSGDQVQGGVQVRLRACVGEPGAEVLEAAVARGDRGSLAARARDAGIGERLPAGRGRGWRDGAPGRGRTSDRISLTPGHVEVGEHLDVVVALDALGADG